MRLRRIRCLDIKLRLCAVEPVLSKHQCKADVAMRSLIVLLAVLAVASAAGQFYVPRAYYTIDSAGHESIPVPLQRLRRSYNPSPVPQPYPPQPYPGSWSDSSSGANAWSNSHSGANGGGYAPPSPIGYGGANPNLGHTYGLAGTFDSDGLGRSAEPNLRMVSSSASASLNSNGQGSYSSKVSTYP